MNLEQKFHRYAGVWEYRLAAWLLANPFQQERQFVSEGEPSTWHYLDEYLGQYCSENPSGRTLAHVLCAHRIGGPLTIYGIRSWPSMGPGEGHLSPKAILAKYWVYEFTNRPDDGLVDFDRLRYLLGNLNDALVSMDIDAKLWPDMARLRDGKVQLEEDDGT